MNDLEVNYKKARDAGTTVRGIIIINLGNPTGQVMTKQNMEDIAKFCHKNSLVILADEVYQKNTYREISFKAIIKSLLSPYNQVELIYFHSTSKDIVGECGGYMELENIDPFVSDQIIKLLFMSVKIRNISLHSNAVGQVMKELIMNPFKAGMNSPEVVENI